jgi:two-component system, sensor histidine kinase LadS
MNLRGFPSARLFALAVACAVVSAAAAPATGSGPAIALDGHEAISLMGAAGLLAPRDSLRPSDVATHSPAPRPVGKQGSLLQLSRSNELWVPLHLRNASPGPAVWQLQVQLPAIDEVTVFDMRATPPAGQSAGDRIARSKWPEAGRYPRFRLQLEPGEERDLVVRVRNYFPIPMAARLIEDSAAQAAEERAKLVLGLTAGALSLLVIACAVLSAIYRDMAYVLYALYAAMLGLSFIAMSGLGGQYFWGDYPGWEDVSKSVFPLAGAGSAVWLVRSLCRLPTRNRMLARIALAAGAVVAGFAIVFAVLGQAPLWITAVNLLLAVTLVLTLAAWSWRRGDLMGAWILSAHGPLAVATLLVLLRMLGWPLVEFNTVDLLAGAIGAILPGLLMALHLRSKELAASAMRARDLPWIDPLTGLLSLQEFDRRLLAAIRRHAKSRHNAAIILVRLTNYSRIHDLHGSAASEQSIVRAVIKLQRLMPDADSLGRIGENTIGMIVETVTARAALSERAARIVAHGLMAVPGLVPETALNFHIAAATLADGDFTEPQALRTALEGIFDSMSPRTRRPIRFLESGGDGTTGNESIEELQTQPDSLVA